MKRFISLALTALLLLCVSPHRSSAGVTIKLSDDFPAELRGCFGDGVLQLLATDRSKKDALRRLFDAHTDARLLGQRAVGGNVWKNASDIWRAKALDLYFELIFGKGREVASSMSASDTNVYARPAENPEVSVTGVWHIVVQMQQGSKNTGVAVLMTYNCRVFDFAQGTWVSQLIDPSNVDALVPYKDR